MEFTRILRDIPKGHIHKLGGKAKSLHRLSRLNVNVPLGFVIFFSAFEHFLVCNNLQKNFSEKLERTNKRNIQKTSKYIQKLIISTPIPEIVESEIKQSFRNLGAEYVAVRSSATSEDSRYASWAGQLESYLNVTEKNLLENVQKCWASLFSSRALSYRLEKGLKERNISIAVIIQKMIQSDISGVAFSVNPVTENREELIIEAAFGLGESIVSGKVTPDTYLINKKIFSLVHRKKIKQILSDKKLKQLSRTVVSIEKHFGYPVDIEWAFKREKLYILQSRPITTLKPRKKQVIQKREYRKLMNRSLSLLGCEIWDVGERVELPKICGGSIFFDPLFAYRPQRAVDVLYNFSDSRQDTENLIQYLKENKYWFAHFKTNFRKKRAKIESLLKRKRVNDFKIIFRETTELWPMIALICLLGDREEQGIQKSITSLCRKMRESSETLLYRAEIALLEIAQGIVPKEHKNFVSVLRFEEINKKNFPFITFLKKRRRGFVYHNGNLHILSLKDYARRKNLFICENKIETRKHIRGLIAYRGVQEGRVKVIFESQDIKKVQKGDIIISSMTTPDLVEAMSKASAFVTDEGGITCHAAIVVREMKKPCIIGTKIATKIFKDGNIIRVDANRGIVTIIRQ